MRSLTECFSPCERQVLEAQPLWQAPGRPLRVEAAGDRIVTSPRSFLTFSSPSDRVVVEPLSDWVAMRNVILSAVTICAAGAEGREAQPSDLGLARGGKRLRAPPLSRHHASSTIRYAAGATPAQAVCCWRGAARRRGGPARVVTGVPLPRPCRGARTTAARPPRPSAHLPRAQCRTRVRRSRTRVGLRPGAAMGDALRPWEGPRLQVRGVLGRRCVGHAEAAEVLLERLQASIS